MFLQKTPYKGARDFYPEDKRIQDYIFSIWRQVASSYGYEEYDAPIIEPLELYTAKTSEEIVDQQTYVFEDRGGRKVTLRPEMTPTVSRMVAARRQELAYPLRLFSIPNLWRYERPQKGRMREHWQLNVDLFGVDNIAGDHEIIQLADQIMQKFGAQRDMYTIRLNSRELINHITKNILGLDEAKSQEVIRQIDKKDKIDAFGFDKSIKELIGDKTDKLLGLLGCPEITNLPDELKDLPAVKRLHKLEMMLARDEIVNAKFDITLMRGFDYYTDIVFEIYDNNPDNNRSLFGGGRYDGLVGKFGVEPLPTAGFGMGDVTTKEFLDCHGLMPQLDTRVDLGVILIGDVYQQASSIIKELRNGGLSVAVDATDKSIDKKIKSADKSGYKNVLFIGEQEIAEQKYKLKDLKTSQEDLLTIEKILGKIKFKDN
jgi:histidyl-tRNA synthetase